MIDWSQLSALENWMKDLWPGREWPPESYETVRDNLTNATEDDMWGWLTSYLETKPEHPPQPAELIAGSQARLRRRIQEEGKDRKALPASTLVGPAALAAYLTRIGVESFSEAVVYEATRKGKDRWDEAKVERYRKAAKEGRVFAP